jgi:hypothetical protein
LCNTAILQTKIEEREQWFNRLDHKRKLNKKEREKERERERERECVYVRITTKTKKYRNALTYFSDDSSNLASFDRDERSIG